MSKLVYLYELDSVRKSKKQIEAGQAALFEEIAVNGNSVVLSFNQLTDSQAFLVALEDERSFQVIIKLFEIGVIKISPYGDTRTASKYVQDALKKVLNIKEDKEDKEEKDKKDNFVFSALPIRFNNEEDKELGRKIFEAIKYGDIQGLKEKISLASSEEDKKKIYFLIRFVKLVLLLSTGDYARNLKKDDDGYKFIDFMDTLINFEEKIISFLPEVKEALCIIKKIKKNIKDNKKNINSRSVWYDKLSQTENTKDMYNASLIIDLCYNYAVEESISNISKHYTELDSNSFWCDFKERFKQYLEDKVGRGHEFTPLDKVQLPSYKDINKDKLPPWTSVNWMIGEFEKRERSVQNNSNSKKDEDNIKKWQRQQIVWFIKYFIGLFGYIVLFVGINFFINKACEHFEILMVTYLSKWWGMGISTGISIFVFGIVSDIINIIFKMPDLIECIGNIGRAIRGLWQIKHFKRRSAYNLKNKKRKL